MPFLSVSLNGRLLHNFEVSRHHITNDHLQIAFDAFEENRLTFSLCYFSAPLLPNTHIGSAANGFGVFGMHDYAVRGRGNVSWLRCNGHLLGEGRRGKEWAAQRRAVCVLFS